MTIENISDKAALREVAEIPVKAFNQDLILPYWMMTEDRRMVHVFPLLESLKNLQSGMNYWLKVTTFNQQQGLCTKYSERQLKGIEERLADYSQFAILCGLADGLEVSV